VPWPPVVKEGGDQSPPVTPGRGRTGGDLSLTATRTGH
jgi:hypothetical protein